MSKFSKQFNIPRGLIQFVDIPLEGDLEAFICPFLIENNKQEQLASRISDRVKQFLVKLNRDFIIPNDRVNGLAYLSHLHEPNEYHLGYSSNNKGKAVSKPRSELIYDALRNNRFAQQGISVTNEAHNVLLLVKGIGQDIMSDILANVCRDIFAEFTHNVCLNQNIQTVNHSIEYFNPVTTSWDEKDIQLPVFRTKKIILLPTFLLSGNRAYANLYNHFISKNYISREMLNSTVPIPHEDKVIKVLKDGSKKAVLKAIYQLYSKPKKDLIDFVLKYQGSLDEFLRYAKEHFPELNIETLI